MSEEWFEIINPNGEVIGQAPRRVCHQHPGLIHQSVHVLVFDPTGKLFLQKRSQHKDVQPGKWDTSVGGHLLPGEKPEDGARRETREELGVSVSSLQPAYTYTCRTEIETERITAFAVIHEGPFQLDPHEISEGRFWTFDEIRNQLDLDVFSPQFKNEFARMAAWWNERHTQRNHA